LLEENRKLKGAWEGRVCPLPVDCDRPRGPNPSLSQLGLNYSIKAQLIAPPLQWPQFHHLMVASKPATALFSHLPSSKLIKKIGIKYLISTILTRASLWLG